MNGLHNAIPITAMKLRGPLIASPERSMHMRGGFGGRRLGLAMQAHQTLVLGDILQASTLGCLE